MSIFQELALPTYYPSFQAAQLAAANFAENLPDDTWLLLNGELGTGKTNWVKGMAKALGIEQTISSPSFGICNIYKGSRVLIHLDAYRLETQAKWEDFVTEDSLDDPFLVAIEWPSCLDLGSLFTKKALVYQLFFWIEKDGRYGVKLHTN